MTINDMVDIGWDPCSEATDHVMAYLVHRENKLINQDTPDWSNAHSYAQACRLVDEKY